VPPRLDLTGQRFGRLIAIRLAGNAHNGRVLWECICDCGNTKVTSSGDLRAGHTVSCGCGKLERLEKYRWKHGRADTPEHIIWMSMRQRCNDPTATNYPRYGGRGIKVCERWAESFANFFADMGPRPSPAHSIDRWPDNDGNYEPGNCRWATLEEQANNCRRNRRLTYQGRTMTMTQWCKELGLSPAMVQQRLGKLGWSVEMALTTPRILGRRKKQESP
jgi:hypothetical protein